MKHLFSFILILMLNISLFAQDDIIEEIKGQYYSISENEYNHHDLTMNYILPAVGETTKTIRFYHVSEQADPERDPYDLDFTLLKVKVKFNVSASSFFTYEYLYNNKEQLIFYFENAEGIYGNYQKRYYYNNEKLIKCIVKGSDEDGGSHDYTRSNNFSQSDLKNSKSGIKKAADYAVLFKEFKLINEVDN
ncbi:MAG: hypothetical protein K8R54_07965 [Bacteroidales bacterium]|nr:hypothetical protein [Bacteroidales bacterium]